MSERARCASCGLPLDPPGPGGLCPICLLKIGMLAAEEPYTEGAPPSAAPVAAAPPGVIGPYHLLQALGEGGMGLVYLAEQREPLVRRVALKLVKPGMNTREVLARFEAERQALALMDHPNIARVLDAGIGPGERPYFVMEYVAGVPITDYCDRHRLPIAERLQIFLQVCAALQHAHQKGIIHRDLKPSNILVTVHDGKAVPKVIDFGIAKATRQGSVEHAAFTRFGMLIGTPEYISPEQAEAGGLAVDTTTDIYSLGVVLYELLTGVLPFDGDTLRQAGYAEMHRIIREQDPPKPSQRVTALGATAEAVARQHQTTQAGLGRQLRGDLDAIAMKAMEKDRTRRYASASEFAADITRYLHGEPVVASPPSVPYRTRKFVRRHRLGVAAAACSIAALVVGLVLSTTFFIRSETARARAEMEAERNRVEAAAMQAALGTDPEAYRQLSEQALALHRRALGPDNPALAPYLVNQVTMFDAVFDPRFRPAWIAKAMQEAVVLIERGLDAGDLSAVKTLLLLSELAGYDDHEMPRLYQKAFELARRPPKAVDRPSVEQLTSLADLLEGRPPDTTLDDDRDSAERVAREVLALRRAAQPSGGALVAPSLLRLADLLVARAARQWTRGDPAAAAEAYREARAMVREAGPGFERRLAEIESDLGGCLVALRSFSEAEPILTRSLRVLQAEEDGGRYATTQIALNRLVGLYTAWGKPGEASRYRERLPAISVEKVRDAGRVRIAPEVRRRKGGRSATAGGRPVWVFQDTTMFGFDDAGQGKIDTSWGVADRAKGTDLPAVTVPTDAAGTPVALLPWTAEEVGGTFRLEAGGVLWDRARDRTLVFYAKAQKDPQRDSERRLGTSIALWSRADAPAIRPLLRPGSDEPTLLFGASEPPWGSAVIAIGDWLYVYGCEAQAPRNLNILCRLARVPLDRPLDRAEWRFYTGSSWSADWRAARPVLDGACRQMSVTWNDHLGKYVAVNTRILSSKLSIRTADRPEGPWSEAIIVEGLTLRTGFPWITPGFVHPELERDGGRVQVVTYGRPVGIAGVEMRAVEIEFRKRQRE